MKGKNTKRKRFYSYQKISFSSEELKPSTTSKRFKKKNLYKDTFITQFYVPTFIMYVRVIQPS